MKHFLRENAIRIAICLVFILIFIGGISSYYNRYAMTRALEAKEQGEAVLREIDLIHDNIRFMDISGRGFALIRKDQFLFWKTEDALNRNKGIFKNLDSLFALQGFQDVNYGKLKVALNHYTGVFSTMVEHLRNDEMEKYLAMLEYDYGKSFYQEFSPFLDKVIAFETNLTGEAQKSYEAAVARNRIVQLALFLLGLPTLAWILSKLIRDERERRKLLQNLELNNKQYLFDDGAESRKDARLILENSIRNLKEASKFVSEISTGNYQVTWAGLTEDNEQLNKHNLAGKLSFMRDEMMRIKEEDKRRIWATQGLSELSEMIRKYQSNLKELNWQVLTYLVKYTGSQQGGLFVLRQNDQIGEHLELAACYAYERRKVIEKTLKIGEGIVGEAFLEGQTMLLKQVPRNYIQITSGLGDATPNCVIIVPMKHNDKVQAVIELATFKQYEAYQIAFLEKAGEFVASAIFTAEQNEKNNAVMQLLQSQTEQMRAQEEELRQNIEELEATQEAMKRQKVKEAY